ncbi:MAG: hypothetical protein R3E31_03870 [Chloroflexota bacterium]
MTNWTRRHVDLVTAVSLFIFLSSVYFATASGITSSNDGSHYALTRTIAENGHFTLDSFDDYAEGNDVAIVDGRLYSDRPPGTAVAAAAIYTLADPLPDPLTPIPSKHDATNPRLPYVLMLPVLAGAGTALLLYLLLRQQGIANAAALLTALFFGLGTAHWKYSSVLFSHALSSLLVLLAVYLALRPVRAWRGYALLGFVLGYAVLVEYSNALLVLLVGGYMLVGIRPFTLRHLAQTILPFALAGLLPAAFLAFYNNANFGSPFTLSYAYALNYPWAGEFGSTFSTPLLPGLKAMLYFGEGDGWCGGPCYNQGIFLLSPLLLLALPGFWLYARRARRAFILTTLIFLVYLLLFAKHYTAHGFTGDGRYLVPFLALLALPIGHFLHWLFGLARTTGQVLAETAVFALFYLSLRNIILHIGFSYNYNLDLSQLDPLIVRPENWRYLLQHLFPNVGNLPLLWLVEAVALLCGAAFVWWQQRARQASN